MTAQGTTVIIIERVQGPGAHIGQGLTACKMENGMKYFICCIMNNNMSKTFSKPKLYDYL